MMTCLEIACLCNRRKVYMSCTRECREHIKQLMLKFKIWYVIRYPVLYTWISEGMDMLS